jgi:hypothetical protein
MRKVRYRGKPAVYVNQTKFKNRKNQGVYTWLLVPQMLFESEAYDY